MAELPYLKFYTSDWLGSGTLRGVSWAGQGVLVSVLCLMWGCKPQDGRLTTEGTPWSLDELVDRLRGKSKAETRRCVQELLTHKALTMEGGAICSPRMMRDIRRFEAKRNAGSKGGNPHLVKHVVNQDVNHQENEEVNQTVVLDMGLGLVSSSPNSERARKKSPDPPGFADFWREYPGHRKTARAQCAAKWAALTEDFSVIMQGLAAWKASADWAKNGGEFIPAPLVWLNQTRWTATPRAAGSAPTVQSSVSQMLAGLNFEEEK